jgi:hypothetical protein
MQLLRIKAGFAQHLIAPGQKIPGRKDLDTELIRKREQLRELLGSWRSGFGHGLSWNEPQASARDELVETAGRGDEQCARGRRGEISQPLRNVARREIRFTRAQREDTLANGHFKLSLKQMHRFVFAMMNVQAAVTTRRHDALQH